MTETFSTAEDNQVEIEIRPFHGVAKLTRDAKALGRFVVAGLPRTSRGTLKAAVTFAIAPDGPITLSAKEVGGPPVQLVDESTNRYKLADGWASQASIWATAGGAVPVAFSSAA